MRGAIAGTALLWLCAACAGTGEIVDLAPGERPAVETDEAGLWMRMDRVERSLRTSGRLERDAALNRYLHDLVCKLAADHCAQLRVYIVRRPGFNATMAPNGMMSVWTGLILRAENEAQLAYVLAHELAHFQGRHSLKRWQDIRAKTDALVFFKLATAVVGLGIVGTVAELATFGSIFAFSREQERGADLQGFEKVLAAGYDAREPARIWQALIEESEAAEDDRPPIFFSSHPSSEERAKSLSQMAEARGAAAGQTGRDRLLALTAGFRRAWLRDELRRRDFGRFEVVLDRQESNFGRTGEVGFFRGEMHRLRAEEGDLEAAVEAYRAALQADDAPAETHRAIGLVSWSQGRSVEARAAFEDYLAANPAAEDRSMVESYIEEIKRDQP